MQNYLVYSVLLDKCKPIALSQAELDRYIMFLEFCSILLTGIKRRIIMNTTYGTYQRFEYQTVDLTPMKHLAIGLLKMIALVLIVAALFVVAMTMFQVLVWFGTWFAANLVQIAIVHCVFYGFWKMKP
jgi:uncharacterized membrane protein YqjE